MDLVHMDLSNFEDEYLNKNVFFFNQFLIYEKKNEETNLKDEEIQMFFEHKEQQ